MRTKANHARAFNSVMHIPNEEWAAQVLRMQVNPDDGIDLLGEKANVEVKFTLVESLSKYPQAWTVDEKQMNYRTISLSQGKEAYWGMARYWLKVPVQEIKTKETEELEALVKKRDLYIVVWSWMYQFPPSHTSGKTEFSEWDHTLRYSKFDMLPQTIKTYRVRKGLVHLTKGVNPKHFSF